MHDPDAVTDLFRKRGLKITPILDTEAVARGLCPACARRAAPAE